MDTMLLTDQGHELEFRHLARLVDIVESEVLINKRLDLGILDFRLLGETLCCVQDHFQDSREVRLVHHLALSLVVKRKKDLCLLHQIALSDDRKTTNELIFVDFLVAVDVKEITDLKETLVYYKTKELTASSSGGVPFTI